MSNAPQGASMVVMVVDAMETCPVVKKHSLQLCDAEQVCNLPCSSTAFSCKLCHRDIHIMQICCQVAVCRYCYIFMYAVSFSLVRLVNIDLLVCLIQFVICCLCVCI